MVRGRKKQQGSHDKVFSIRVTTEQYDILLKNQWIKEEIVKQVREYINVYSIKK